MFDEVVGKTPSNKAKTKLVCRALQTEEITLSPQDETQPRSDSPVQSLEEVVQTLCSDPATAPLDVLEADIESLEGRIAALSGPSGRISQLSFRRDRLAALGPTMTKEGGSMKSCERTMHQMCMTAAEDIAALCSELGYVLTDLEAHGGALADLHQENSADKETPPLLSRLSLENFIDQGGHHRSNLFPSYHSCIFVGAFMEYGWINVCACACFMYELMYVCGVFHAHVCISVCMFACMCVCYTPLYVGAHAHSRTYTMYERTCVQIYMCMHKTPDGCIHPYIRIHKYAHMHTHTHSRHAYIHTQTNKHPHARTQTYTH